MDTPQRQALHYCLRRIEQRMGWGSAAEWTGADFETLSERILVATGVRLSPTTLKRVWGRIQYAGSPSPATLDALAVFAGEENWRSLTTDFHTKHSDTDHEVSSLPRPSSRSKPHPALWLAGAALTALILTFVLSGAHESAPPPLDPADFSFSARPVTRGIPNSVVFDYAADAAPTDSVFIQQSWDDRRRTPVSRTGRHHTAIYYEPGYFRAKLVVGSQVVREAPLFVPSDGWVIAAFPPDSDIPAYFGADSLYDVDTALTLSPSHLQKTGIELLPDPPRVRFSYVDTLTGWSSHHLDLSTEFRSSFSSGTAVCQYFRLIVLLETDAIIVPLSQPGCVAELDLYAPGISRSGPSADLSAFGTDLNEWTRLHLTSEEGRLKIRLNDQQIFVDSLSGSPKPLVGMRLEFKGPGSVKSVRLGTQELLRTE